MKIISSLIISTKRVAISGIDPFDLMAIQCFLNKITLQFATMAEELQKLCDGDSSVAFDGRIFNMQEFTYADLKKIA